MLSQKGRDELHQFIASDLVNNWAETDKSLQNLLRLLLSQRPDLLQLYFIPQANASLAKLPMKERANIMLCLLKAGVIAEAGTPAILEWSQAWFYWSSRLPQYVEMAETWAQQNPERCEKPIHKQTRRKSLLPDILPES